MNAVFALFPDETRARDAIDEVMAHDELAPDIEGVITHGAREARRFTAREMVETNAGPALRRSVLVGVLGGAAVGALLAGPLALMAGGPWTGAFFGAILGSVFSIFGAIVGAGHTDRTLVALARNLKRGQMLVTFKVGHRETEAAVQRIVRRFGAVPASKSPGGL